MARYASYNKKQISIYAGDDILFLLNKYKAELNLSSYIQNVEEVLAHVKNVVSKEHDDSVFVWHDYYLTKQFNLAYRRQDKSRVTGRSIPCQALVAEEIHITNQDLFHEKTISIDYSNYEVSENPAIEVYFCGQRPTTVTLPPSSTTVIVVFLKVASPVKRIDLPEVHIYGKEVKREPYSRAVNCCWLGEIPYMGNGWVKLQEMANAFEGDTQKRFVVLSGQSGVGKTRFLQEAAGHFYTKGYRIISLDFRSLEDLSLKKALYHILSNIYIAEADDTAVYAKSAGELYEAFTHILFDNDDSYDCAAHIDQLSNQLSTLLRNKRIILLLDNVQDVGRDASAFFETLLSNLGNQEGVSPLAILCFNKDFLHPQKASEKLRQYLLQLNGCFQIDLTDFTYQDAMQYLTECLDPGGHRLDLRIYFEQIVKKFGGNPFVLKHFVLYLKDRGIIQFSDAMTYISNYEELKIALSELPEGINQLLGCRYQYLLKSESGITDENMRKVLWCILFFGGLQDQIIQQAGLDPCCVESLLDHGFANRDLSLGVVFSHQLIEKHFCLLFMGGGYDSLPMLRFLPDKPFLEKLLSVIETYGESHYCVESMLLRVYLSCTNSQSTELALKMLTLISPRAILLPLIWTSMRQCLEKHTGIDPKLEFCAAYALSVASQDRLDVPRAVILSEPFIRFEQITYTDKTAASEEMVLYFKHFTFQLPVERKFGFLDWLTKNAPAFGLTTEEHQRFQGWIANRYSKNLSASHRFREAETYAQKALDIALLNKDFESAAEAEIEYGNCFAYSNPKKTADHWEKCVQYISKIKNKSVYFQVLQHAYFMFCKMLCNDLNGMEEHVRELQELRGQTFLYQKLLIDDVCADYSLLCYMDRGKSDLDALIDLLSPLTQMKAESYLHTPIFTILATYKLFTVYRLLCAEGLRETYQETGISLAYELIDNGVFERNKFQYSQMILSDLAEYTRSEDKLIKEVCAKLPPEAQKEYRSMLNKTRPTDERATTVLSDSRRRINLLHFNYVF